MIHRSTFHALAILTLVGCTRHPEKMISSRPSSDKHIQSHALSFTGSVPSDPNSTESQLLRFSGQTRFLNAIPSFHRFRRDVPGGAVEAPISEAAPVAKAEDKRVQQESDVFKWAAQNSNILYLLNNFRGLQVIDFEKGTSQAEIIGRAPPTGRTAETLYQVESPARLIALESSYNQGIPSSHLVVYDMSKTREPRFLETVTLEGQIADSRLVGEVLYIASYTPQSSDAPGKGLIRSFRVTDSRLLPIAEHALELPVNGRENMNIMESTDQSGRVRYTLAAILSDWPGGFWEESSGVELVDITDPRGKIIPLMMSRARGQIRERTQTLLRDDTLIVTSQFTPPANSEGQRLPRIAVETFQLPRENSELLTETEADYRHKHIERALAQLPEELRENQRQKLLEDPSLGIKGRFVRSANGTLRKLMADTIVTVGDTRGQGASLQDVRVSGNRLYAFWVPTNLVDPFDLFDISNPKQGTPHLKRLEFDGWVERAIPFDAAERHFVLGLGYIIPAVNNDQNRRYPQVLLFEVTDTANGPQLVERSHLTLKDKNLWANFNDADRMIDVRFTGEGQGEILFPLNNSNGPTFQSGGKLIQFHAVKSTLQEGAFLVGGSSWLRRVFRNPELTRIHTFSDRSLGSFETASSREDTALTAQRLELARELRAFVPLASPSGMSAIQIISDDSSGLSTSAQTLLRRVALENPDAELNAVQAEIKLPGRYVTYFAKPDHREILLYTAYLEPNAAPWTGTPPPSRERLLVHRIRLSSKDFEKPETQQTEPLLTENSSWFLAPESQPVVLSSGLIVIPLGNQLTVTDSASPLRIRSVALSSLVPSAGRDGDFEDFGIVSLNNNLYLKYVESIPSPSAANEIETRLLRHWITPVKASLQGFQTGVSVNIPGTPLLLTPDSRLITSDSVATDIALDAEASLQTRRAFAALKLEAEVARLTDLEEDTRPWGDSVLPLGTALAYFDSENSSPQNPLPTERWASVYQRSTTRALMTLSVDAEGRFIRHETTLGGELSPDARILNAHLLKKGDEQWALLRSQDSVQLLAFDSQLDPRLVSITNNSLLEPVTGTQVPCLGEAENVTLLESQKSLITGSGLWGAQKFSWKD